MSLLYLQCFVWELLVSPLLELNVYGGVEGTRVHRLSSRQVDVLNYMSRNTFPQLLLQNRLPEREKDISTFDLIAVLILLFCDKLSSIFLSYYGNNSIEIRMGL